MMKKPGKLKLFSLLLLLLQFCSTHAQKQYDFNSVCQEAYKEITSLRINSGQQLINTARQQNPNNLIPDFLEGYIDFFVLFFNEDPAEYQRRKQHFTNRIQQLSSGPSNSPFHNYCLSVCYLQKATVAIKFGEKWSAAWDFRKAFAIIKQNRKDYPSFLPNDMIYAPMEVVVDVIPDGYKWMASLLGLKGSVKDGMQLMNRFVNSNDTTAKFFFNEAAFYYCYLVYYIQNEPAQVFDFIRQKKLDVVNNHLFAYLAANLGINNKQTEYGKAVILNRNTSADYMATPVWDFELAYAKLHHLEVDQAALYFSNFLKNFRGKFYVKDSYQKLSWCYFLQNNLPAAEAARNLLLQKGSLDTDADKQAYREAQSGSWPNPLLLKARLLNDGGYQREALNILLGKNTEDFNNLQDKLEFNYRVARIYDDMGRNADAIKVYETAIKLGEHRKEYYASRAALQIGYIYERQNQKQAAIRSFQQCLSMDDHDFKNSIDQKAKAGIARCNGN